MTLLKFNLQAWASNSQSLRELAQQHKVAELKETVKVLGLCWNVKLNKLFLCSKPELVTCTPVMKHEILCYTSSIFDLLGLVTPVTVTAKLLLQELWQEYVSWDTELNETTSSSGLPSQQTS